MGIFGGRDYLQFWGFLGFNPQQTQKFRVGDGDNFNFRDFRGFTPKKLFYEAFKTHEIDHILNTGSYQWNQYAGQCTN